MLSEEVIVHTGYEVLMEVDADFWQSTRDLRPAAQALPNPVIKYYYYIN